MKLHELSVKRPIAVTMVVLIFAVIGLYSLTMLPIEMTPDMDMSMAIVVTQYSNVGSSEVENLVTKTVESAISAAEGVNSITSQTSEGVSMVMVEFNTGTDMNQAVSDMKDKLGLIEDYLPEGADDPMVMKLDTNMMPVMMMSAGVEGYDLIQAKQYIEDNVQSKLESVAGVASVSVTGATERQIEVVVDPEKMFGYNMSLSDLVGAVAAQNQNLPAGSIEGMNKSMPIRSVGKFKSTSDIERVPLMTSTGQVIYLRDVATVKDSYSDESTYARLNGENSLSITISKQSDANTVDVVNAIIKELDELKAQNSKFTYDITMEQASYIEDAISSVADNAVTGGLLAIIILLLFLGSIRSSLVIGIAMPVSVVTTFVGMYFSGMSLNVVSLGGLALGVGMLVDNAVVVLENIFRRRKAFGEDPRTAGISGTGEVIGAVVASVLTTCIVYVPIMFIDNIMAVMFKQLAFSIIFSQVASLIVTFLLVPMLSSKIKDDKPDRHLGFILKPFAKLLDKLYVLYERTVRFVLKRRKSFMAIVLAVFVLSLFVLSQLGMTLMPSSDEGTISVSVEMPQGTKLEDTDELSRQIEDIIAQNQYVDTISARIGSSTMSAITGAASANTASITVTLVDKSERPVSTSDVVEELRGALSSIAGAELELEASSSTMAGMSSDEIQFQYSGSDDAELEAFVLDAEKVLAGINGITETSTSLSETKPEVRIYVDSNRASRYGLTTATATTLVYQTIEGATASRFTENDTEYDIVIVYPDDYITDYSELDSLRLKTPTGQWITLGDIADVKIEQGYATLTRVDQKRTVTVTGKLYGIDMQTVNTAYEAELAKIGIPDGISVTAGGTYEIMMDAMSSLLLAIILGILLMYLVMAAQFESLSQPFIILFTLPLAMIGVVLSLVIAQSPLSVIGCIGILMLIGIVVNNAIVLIDFINTSKIETPDMARTDLVVNAGLTRMRPILMTSLTSILGFLPMAVSSASGSEMMQPLAVVLVGGLTVGTFLTLYVIPVVYTLFDDFKNKRAAKKLARKEKRSAEKQN